MKNVSGTSVLLFISLILCACTLSYAISKPAFKLPQSSRHSSRKRRSVSYYRSQCLSASALTCYLTPTTNNTATGLVTFMPLFVRLSRRRYRCRVQVSAAISGLSPGYHGFHIHTWGDVRSPDGKSTGGHFSNPKYEDLPHGYPHNGHSKRHWGDLGNLYAHSDGSAYYTSVDQVIKLKGILGRGMIVHALQDQGPDAQPTGAAGGRQAHCVIGYANPEL